MRWSGVIRPKLRWIPEGSGRPPQPCMRRNYKVALVKESQESTARTLEAYMREPGRVRSTREAMEQRAPLQWRREAEENVR